MLTNFSFGKLIYESLNAINVWYLSVKNMTSARKSWFTKQPLVLNRLFASLVPNVRHINICKQIIWATCLHVQYRCHSNLKLPFRSTLKSVTKLFQMHLNDWILKRIIKWKASNVKLILYKILRRFHYPVFSQTL